MCIDNKPNFTVVRFHCAVIVDFCRDIINGLCDSILISALKKGWLELNNRVPLRVPLMLFQSIALCSSQSHLETSTCSSLSDVDSLAVAAVGIRFLACMPLV